MATRFRENPPLPDQPGLLALRIGEDLVDAANRAVGVASAEFDLDRQFLQRDQRPEGTHGLVEPVDCVIEVDPAGGAVGSRPPEEMIRNGGRLRRDCEFVVASGVEVPVLRG